MSSALDQVIPQPPAHRPPVRPAGLARRSPLLIALFKRYVRGYLRRHFHAVRLARTGRPDLPPDLPLVVVLNHPSWWDPLVGALLSDLFPGRAHFAPIDAQALRRYRFFERLGFFGVARGTPAGARAFLRIGTAVLASPGSAVWVTAQGQFTDVRRRPPRLQAGVGHLARRLRGAAIVPLALEYTFWEERLPEALARFGEPLFLEDGRVQAASWWLAAIERRLAAAQDALAQEAQQRNVGAFATLLEGRAGVGGVYDQWRRLRAWWRGEPFHAEHGPSPAAPPGEDVP